MFGPAYGQVNFPKILFPTHVLFTKLEERKIVLILFVPVYVSQRGSGLTVFPCNNVKCQQQQIYVTFYVWKQHFSNTFLTMLNIQTFSGTFRYKTPETSPAQTTSASGRKSIEIYITAVGFSQGFDVSFFFVVGFRQFCCAI